MLNQMNQLNFLNTFLTLDIKNNPSKLQSRFEILQKNKIVYHLQISQYEVLKIDDLITSYSNIHNIKTAIKFLVNENQYVNKHEYFGTIRNIFSNTRNIRCN